MWYNGESKGKAQDMNSDIPIYDEEDEAYIAEQIRLREEAEAAGAFNETPLERMTDEQIMALHFAMSSLSQLVKETDSTLSELVQASGFNLKV